MKDTFDRVILLSLRRRADRLRSAMAQFEPGSWPFLPPSLFRAVDGAAVPTPPGWEAGSGAWGCMQSHRQILEAALMDGVNHLLVLEDDCVLRKGFREQVAGFLVGLPADHDGLFLGGQHHAKEQPVAPGVVRCINTQRTHAYSCRRPWMEELYRIWCSPRATVHCDWLMGPACGRYHIYAPDPFLIGQSRSHSDISGRTNPAKFWQPPSGQEPIIVLRAEQDVVRQLRDVGWHTGFTRQPGTDYDTGLCEVVAGRKALRPWIDELMWEVVSEEGWVLCVWHPGITVAQVRAAWSGPVVEISAKCVRSAVTQWRAWLACREGSVSA